MELTRAIAAVRIFPYCLRWRRCHRAFCRGISAGGADAAGGFHLSFRSDSHVDLKQHLQQNGVSVRWHASSAMDLMGGRCSTGTREEEGLEYPIRGPGLTFPIVSLVHLIDLDGGYAERDNVSGSRFVQHLPCQVGGGVRTSRRLASCCGGCAAVIWVGAGARWSSNTNSRRNLRSNRR